MTLTQREVGAARPPRDAAPPAEQGLLYTRYCAAPRPAHPVGEPSFIHALLVAAWLGRLIDPLPHPQRRPQRAPRG